MLLSTNVGFGLNLHNHSNKRDGRTERVSHTFDYVIILDQSGVARNLPVSDEKPRTTLLLRSPK